MRVFARLGLRTRLAIALVGTALLAVGLATVLSDRGLHPRVSAAAQQRLDGEAARFAATAAQLYAQGAGWRAADLGNLAHLAMMNGLTTSIAASDGTPLATSAGGMMMGGTPPSSSAAPKATAAVVAGGRTVGRVTIWPTQGSLLNPEEIGLQHSLDRLHIIAAGVSAGVALLLAVLFAQTLTGPLRRIRSTARQMEGGDLGARVEARGDPEVRAVGHALNRLAETLEHEEAMRKETVADLAHELRTPVNGLLTRIEAAQDGVLEPEENLAAMHAEALRLTRLLDDIQRLAEAEQPGLLVEKQPVDLAEIAAAEAEAFAPQFAEKGVSFEIEIESVVVAGDAARLNQVAANLLSNALRYTGEGGAVSLGVRRSADAAVLEIRDTGIGIPADDLRHIFKRFWRGEKSRSRTTGGAGIGLAIVNELVRAHDGRIAVESAPGIGSTFTVTLPAVVAATSPRSAASSPDLRTPVRI